MKKLRFEVVDGETEHVLLSGKRVRRPTVLIKVGSWSFSKKAFVLGAALVLAQVLDGVLTYIGLSIYGKHMEGNPILRQLIFEWGKAPALTAAKLFAIGAAVILAFQAHTRRWVRPIILVLVCIYLILAIVPWTVLIHKGM